MISPFRVLIGIFCLTLTLGIIWSIVLTSTDRIFYSKCGFSCGFILDKKQIFNPLDSLLVNASMHFPLDYLFFFILSSYIFICCLYGIIKFGFNYFCFKEYEIKKDSSVPQALIIAAFIINLTILVLTS